MANPLPGWLQGSYQLASTNVALQRAVNIYPEIVEAKDKVPGYFKGCPGLTAALATLPTSPVRALWAGGAPLSNNSRLFAIAGSKLYEIASNGSIVGGLDRGDVGNDGYPAQIIANGQQLFVVSAGQAYIDNGGAASGANVAAISIPNPKGGTPNDLVNTREEIIAGFHFWYVDSVSGDTFDSSMIGHAITVNAVAYTVLNVFSGTSLQLGSNPGNQTGVQWSGTYTQVLSARSGAFLDSFFVAALSNSKQLQVSAPNDGTSWDPLDIAVKESYPDNIGRILADHQELLVLGESHSEVWQAPGADTNFPFQPNESFAMNVGIAAIWSAAVSIDGPLWIGAGERGKPRAYFAKGFVPVRISTPAIEQKWAKYSTVFDAVGFVYEMDGHEFWQLSFPTGDETWVYDITASQQMGIPMWHERNSYDGSAFHRHRASCYAYAFDKHLVGDFATGAIYQMSPDVFKDNGQPITCIRVLPHLPANRVRQFFTMLQLDLETGGGAGNALTVVVEWSDDGGTTFVGGGSAFTLTLSTTKKLDRAVFWQLGSADDRVFRITITGNARKAILNALLAVVEGTS